MRAVRASRQGRFRPQKGQHFLRDAPCVRRILEALGAGAGTTLVEIGPGRGALTWPLLHGGARVIAFEIDAALAGALREGAAGLPLTVVTGDALEVDFEAALAAAGAVPPVPLVGNLPYESATPMLRAFIRRPDLFSRCVVMIQKEVADRLVARPRTSAYGFLTLDVGAHGAARRLFDVPARAFVPSPKVVSTVVELVPRPAARGTESALAVASAGFSQRRKTLANALAASWGREAVVKALDALGLLPTVRAEELSLPGYFELAVRLGPPLSGAQERLFKPISPATIS